MATKIFVNIVVKDLEKSKAFFTALGWSFNPQFTDASAACLVISDTIYAMLLLPDTMKRFSGNKEVVDAKKQVQAILSISMDDKAGVDSMAEKVLAAGGSESRPADDYGWMYARAMEDLDGNQWEFIYVDEANIPSNPGAQA